MIKDKNQQTEEKKGTAVKHDQRKNIAAHEQADEDISNDPELHNQPEPGDDLDEGELARFDNDNKE